MRLVKDRGWLAAGSLLLAALVSGVSGCRPAGPTSLLLITIDTLRADHLSAYGYTRDTSPGLDALAARGVLFQTIIAPLPETGPSCAALLTGRWPAHLGMRGNSQPLDGRFDTLAGRLAGAGYRTAGFVSGFPLVRRLSGLDRGFSHYDDTMPDPRGSVANVQRLAEKTTDAARLWLRRNPDGPFFLWVHYYDPHGDYAPGPPYDSLFSPQQPGPSLPGNAIPRYQQHPGVTDGGRYVALYDGEIRRVDTHVARLIKAVEESNGAGRTLIAVTADHGESLLEHDYFLDHGNELYMPSVHIPLILSGPGVPTDGRRIGGAARTVDIMPTLLDLLGLPSPDGIAGVSLKPQVQGGPPLFLESFSEARFKEYRALAAGVDVGPKLAARDDRYSVILRLAGGRVELYDRSRDPAENRDLLETEDSTRGRLGEELKQRLLSRETDARNGTTPATPVFTPAIRRQLDLAFSGETP